MGDSAELLEVKKSLFHSFRKYQNLYPKLTKEFCQKIWGEEVSQKKWSEAFFSRIQESLTQKGFSFSELSGEQELVTQKKLKEVIAKIFERMATKGNSSHKLQAVFSPLNFQRQFAPGGFHRSSFFESHLNSFEESLDQFTRESLAFDSSHVVYSNEAFGEQRYPRDNEVETRILEGSQRENNGASFSKGGEEKLTERVLFGENYFLKVETPSFVSFTAHFSSIKEEDREEKSQFFCEKRLPTLLQELASVAGKRKFAFAGDVNLYFFKEENGKRVLRREVQKLLSENNFVLFAPSGFVNKNIRPEIHEQWHKLKEDSGRAVEAYPDSMVVLEPFEEGYDYNQLKENGLGASQDLFFPDGSAWVQEVSQILEPFGPGFLMDHIPVRGRLVSILNGADGDGTGNSSKAFLEMASGKSPSAEDFKRHLEAMRINVETTCAFIETLC